MERVVQKLAGAAALALIATGCSCVADFRSFEIEGDGGAPVDAEADGGGGLAYDAIVAGDEHFCVLSAGEVACWGDNRRAQVSPSEALFFDAPVPVSLGGPAIALAADGDRSCAVLSDRRVWCWGAGVGVVVGGDILPTPTDIGLFDVRALTIGGAHVCALHTDGSVSCRGDNGEGQLGRGDREGSDAPVTVAGLEASQIAAGGSHSCALLTDRTVRCWGDNVRFAAGGESQGDFLEPGPRLAPSEGTPLDDVTAIRCGEGACCAASSTVSSRGVYCWGDNEWSVLGPSVPRSEGSSRNDSGRPLLALAGETEALDLHDAVCAVQGGEVFCWGSTTFGQLGDGVRLDLGVRAEPAAVSGLPPVQDVAVGLSRACAVAGDAIWCWGTVRRLGDAGTFEEVRFDAEPARLPR